MAGRDTEIMAEMARSNEALTNATAAASRFRQLAIAMQYEAAEQERILAMACFEVSMDAFMKACRLGLEAKPDGQER